MISQIDGTMLKNMIISGANQIENHKKEINNLNVFPVPDGDTGTNMSLTMSAAVRELKSMSSDSAEDVAQKIANALLRGARGNSGVILSLIFRGFSKAMVGVNVASSKDFARGLRLGVEMAYKAVMKPTEGTILTVARLSSDYAVELADQNRDVIEVLEKTIVRAKEVLEDTPNILPVLKQANVVDAGGMGLVVIYEGALAYLKTGIITESNGQEKDTESKKMGTAADFTSMNTEDIKFQYCTEFIVLREKQGKDPQKLRAYLEGIGDSAVVVDDDEIIKVHVHTNNPGKAVEEAITYGSLTSVKIENMKEQHSELVVTAEEEEADQEMAVAKAEKVYGFVVVSSGEGIANVFYDLGVDGIVQGGQTMNPSTEDILKAINQTPASTVFVFPNNKNIIMAAELAVPLSKEKKIVVIPTKTIAQGVTALLNFDESATAEDNQKNMEQAIETVKTGQITFAARDSQFDGHEIKEGQMLGMAEGKLKIIGEDLKSTVLDLIELMKDDQNEILTLYYGADVTEEQAQEIYALVQEKYDSQLEVTLIDGGQPIYYFIIAIE